MREKILNIAISQLKQGGYEHLNFAAIANELDTTRANLHYHFKNKETLALAATEEYTELHNTQFAELGNAYKGDFFGFAIAMEEQFWNEAFECGDSNSCICSQLIREFGTPDALNELAQKHFGAMHGLIGGMVQSAVESGQLDKDTDVEKVGMQLGTMMVGLMAMCKFFPTIELAKENLGGLAASWIKYLK